MEIVLVRHGESLGNIVDYDCPDPELTVLYI
jgi:broad specificity phosphatase PhoE